jgi:hypothetical protein
MAGESLMGVGSRENGNEGLKTDDRQPLNEYGYEDQDREKVMVGKVGLSILFVMMKPLFFFFLVGLEFEPCALCLKCRCSNT